MSEKFNMYMGIVLKIGGYMEDNEYEKAQELNDWLTDLLLDDVIMAQDEEMGDFVLED